MQTTSSFIKTAALCVTVLTLSIAASTSQAGGFLNMTGIAATSRVSPGGGGNNTQPIEKPTGSSSVSPARHGTDDPAGHDANDDHGRGRGRGRGR
jgi:hypothetical protein